MGASLALKKEISAKKLSTGTHASSRAASPFDGIRLINELLSLKNPQLTPKIAHLISDEVKSELKRRPSPQISAELISEIVQFKLQELGLIEFRKGQRKKMLKTSPLPKSTAEEENTVSLPEIDHEVNFAPNSDRFNLKAVKSDLPTLEKFIRPSTTNHNPPSPPKASLQLSPRALNYVREKIVQETNDLAVLDGLEKIFERIAQTVAEVESDFTPTIHVPTLSVEFYNSMANQEFYPHVPSLLGETHSPADGAEQVWIPLSATLRVWEQTLQEAQEIWRQGKSVTFGLDTPKGEGWRVEDFERLMDAVEKAILELPDNVEIPRWVGLNLSISNPHALDFVKIALSGKYYPKFTFHLGLTNQVLEKLNQENDLENEEEVFTLEQILKNTWKKSEPSIVFLNRIPDRDDVSSPKVSTAFRPGGGPPLLPYEVCNLGSLNLSIVASGDDVDWVKLRRMIRTAVHFLDNLIEITDYPTDKVAQQSKAHRKIGLGVMGFAELLIKLGIPYDSDAAVILAEKLMRYIYQEASIASQTLAKQRGAVVGHLRHGSLTAIVAAPQLAVLADVTPGFDPLMSVVENNLVLPLLKNISERRKLWNADLEKEILEKSSVCNSMYAPKPLRKLFATQDEISLDAQLRIQGAFQKHSDGSIGKFLQIPESDHLYILKEVLRTANVVGITQLKISQNTSLEIENVDQITLESQEVELQPYDTDSLMIEEEVQIEEDAPAEEEAQIAEAFLATEEVIEEFVEKIEAVEEVIEAATEVEISLALESSSQSVPEAIATEKEPTIVNLPQDSIAASIIGTSHLAAPPVSPQPRSRPEVLTATSRVVQTGCGPMTVSFARDETGPYELRAQLGKAGGCASAQNEAISRLVSLLMSMGVDSKLIYYQLRGIRCPASAIDRGEAVLSCSDAISKVFERELGFKHQAKETPDIPHQLFSKGDAEDEITEVTELFSHSSLITHNS